MVHPHTVPSAPKGPAAGSRFDAADISRTALGHPEGANKVTPEKIIDIAKLPAGPRILARLMCLINEPHVHLADIAELFRTDAALSARVVAFCTSVYYSRGGEPPSNIREAVLRVGFTEIARIAKLLTLTDLSLYPTHLYAETTQHFWERSVHTALVMDAISDHDEQAYTAGLMSLTGIWILCRAFPDVSTPISEGELILQARMERILTGSTYAQVGGIALEQWGFDPRVSEAVGWQLEPQGTPNPEHHRYAAWLNQAVHITDCHYGAAYHPECGMTAEDVADLNQRIAVEVARIATGRTATPGTEEDGPGRSPGRGHLRPR